MGEHKLALATRLRALAESGADREGLVRELLVLAQELEGAVPASGSGEEGLRPYMFLANATEDAMALVARDYTYTAVNRAFFKMLASPVENPLGMHIAHTWGDQEFNRNIRSALNLCFEGEDVSYEAWFRTGDGKQEYIEFCYYPYRDVSGIITHAAVIFRNLTDLRRAIEESRKSEQRLRNVIGGIQEAICTIDSDGVLTYVSPRIRNLIHMAPSRIVGRCFDEFIYPEDLEGVRESFSKALKGGGFEHEFRLLTAEGGFVWVRAVTSRLMLDGELVGMTGTLIDITDSRRIEQEIKQANVFMEKLIDAVPDPVYVKDEGHAWLVVNRAFSELIGRPKEELLGKRVSDCFPQDQAKAFMDKDGQLFKSGGSMTHEEKILDGNGRWRIMSTNKAVLESPLRSMRLLVGVARDVTEQKRLEEILWRAKEDAESLAEAKSRFLANMSHEIRTPLNGVIGMLQLMLSGELHGRLREYAETAMTSAKVLLGVINDILDLSKIEAGKMKIAWLAFDPRALVQSVVRAMARSAQDGEVALIADIDPAVPTTLVGGAPRIRQILFNLVGNALKFTRSGEVRIGVSCLSSPGRRLLLMCVEDTGVGIPDRSVERIFDDFAQADDSYTREYQGAGLGLSIVKRLVRLMDGTVSMMSQEGKGTTVCFTVRVEEAPTYPDAALAAAPDVLPGSLPGSLPGAPAEKPLPFRRALVVEDNAVNQLLACRFLDRLGIASVGVGNGLEAVHELERSAAGAEAYDLVLMDIQMPVMDGLEATAKIRACEAEGVAALPIVALTAHAMEGDRERFLQRGMDGYAAKPLVLEELQQVLLGVSARISGG